MSLVPVVALTQSIKALRSETATLPERIVGAFLTEITKHWIGGNPSIGLRKVLEQALSQDNVNFQTQVKNDRFLYLQNIPKVQVLNYYQAIDIDYVGEKFLHEIQVALGKIDEHIQIQINLSADESLVRVYIEVQNAILDQHII